MAVGWSPLAPGRTALLALAVGNECSRDRVIDPIEPDKLDLLSSRLRHVFEILPVARWQQDGGDAGARSGEDLLLDTADRQDQAAQRYFPGHCGIVSHRPAREKRRQGHEHRNASARSVLGNGTRRHMNMNVRLLEQAGIDA